MRISESLRNDVFVNHLQKNQKEIARLQKQLATAKQFTYASENHVGFVRSRSLESLIRTNEQYATNADRAMGYLNAGMSSLEDLADTVISVRTLMVSMGTETRTASDRAQAAEQLTQLRNQMIGLLNTQWQDVHVFAGGDGSRPAITVGPDQSLVMSQSESSLKIPIADGVSIESTLRLESVTKAGDLDLFALIDSALTALRTDDPATLRELSDSFGTYHSSLTGVVVKQAEMFNRVVYSMDRMNDIHLLLSSELSDTKDTDMAAAFSDLQKYQAAYEALLAVHANRSRSSLLDYL